MTKPASLPPYITLEKAVGETPLQCVEAYRATHPELTGVPLAYAGRLDPMASGQLLILVGDECKRQTEYHSLDKTYEFSVLIGISSDTGDVLGRLATDPQPPSPTDDLLQGIATELTGPITLPYPAYSSKTIQGKQLHQWALADELHTITIPTKTSTIYELTYRHSITIARDELCQLARQKIDTLPPVMEASKALGRDFRRTDIRVDWQQVAANDSLPHQYHIAHFTCTCSSGTYIRTLSALIATRLGTQGLAWHIHRSAIGRYHDGEWQRRY
jgi:tRNA pseudouridine(55) synthase